MPATSLQLSGENADKLARLFQRIARNELRIVIWYGAVLGFFIGLFEVGFYAVLDRDAGYASHWYATRGDVLRCRTVH